MLLLFDTNVVLDVILRRLPWVDDGNRLWQFVVAGAIDGFLCASGVTDVFYIVRRLAGVQSALTAVRDCLDAFQICPVNDLVLTHALALPGNDFEDNVQIACAIATGLDGIVTRDAEGFRASPIPVFTPAAALARLAPQR